MALDRDLERELLVKAQDGDGKAFGELAKDAWSRMYAVCLSITGNKADAEDALQNALTSAWRNLHRFDGGARFSTWAYRIASNSALQLVRSRRELPDEDAGVNEVAAGTGVDRQVAASMVVRDALQTLAPEFREAITLREYAGMSYAEIAQHQGIGVQTVKSRISRARRKLLSALEEAGVSSE
ncbi:RNA polymerase sigma factor [uncultured Corynebacterium sp.]|uniref:RNA polymerase sigma factor n=1 Tax=uncultured Corynebacterium sp. TaxID=159447 RepID=UPI0025E5660F|nr:sigma-70 family RNA polymerase sigma factor [uncultured Corynebacterium sp.]